MRPLLPTAALVAAWPATSHAAAWLGRTDLLPWVTAAAIAILALLAATRLHGGPRVAALLVAVVAPILAAFAPSATVYVPPVAIDAMLAIVFAQTLRPGQEPMISRFARRERGGVLEPDIAAYTRRLTAMWVALFAGMGLAAALLAWLAPIGVWSLFCNVVAYLLVAALLVGEYAYRRFRFRHYEHASLGAFLRSVIAGFPRATPE